MTKHTFLEFAEIESRVVLHPWLRQIYHHIPRILIEDLLGFQILHERRVPSHFLVQKASNVWKKLVVLHDNLIDELLLAEFAIALA